jgi:iron complex outermembrane receptor protein
MYISTRRHAEWQLGQKGNIMDTLRSGTALALLFIACAAPARAQTVAAPASVSARDDTDGDPTLGEVTVTARRRAEDAQHIPGSLSVVGGDLLDRSYTVNTQQLSQLVPALNYSSANPRNTAFTIRGLGSSVVAVSQANDGLEPGVGFYVDQVYHARPATAAFDFSDIAQVEVLRGPQGTLFGKNSTAGAINITTRLPTFTPEATERTVGRQLQFRAGQGGGLRPDCRRYLGRAYLRVVTRRDGVIDNVRTGQDQNGIGNQAVRGQLLYKPSDIFQARLIADFTNFQSNCCTQVYYRVADRPASVRSLSRQYPALAAGLGYKPAQLQPL